MIKHLQAILYQALAEPVGLLVSVQGNVETARQAFYRARKEAGDPALTVVQVRLSPLAEGQLILVKGMTKAQTQAALEAPTEAETDDLIRPSLGDLDL